MLYLCAYEKKRKMKKEMDAKQMVNDKALFLVLMMLLCVGSTFAQKRERYEFKRNLPVYADSLIADFDYPLAWGNSDIKDFDEWRRVARQKVFDCMLAPGFLQRL